MAEASLHTRLLGALLAALFVSPAGACTSAMWSPGPSPFSQQETERALAPVAQIQRVCYAASHSSQQRRTVNVEFVAYVNKAGDVMADPIDADVHDPALIECLKQRLDQLHFPAKDAADQFRLRLQLGPSK